MAIFRGDGGAGDSNTDATISIVTEQANIATREVVYIKGSFYKNKNTILGQYVYVIKNLPWQAINI